MKAARFYVIVRCVAARACKSLEHGGMDGVVYTVCEIDHKYISDFGLVHCPLRLGIRIIVRPLPKEKRELTAYISYIFVRYTYPFGVPAVLIMTSTSLRLGLVVILVIIVV